MEIHGEYREFRFAGSAVEKQLRICREQECFKYKMDRLLRAGPKNIGTWDEMV